ncbi:MAG TPA: acylphosphatase [Candidatus Dormibacteraeota bacterium]|jgi:acylphosphatase|nr:acylphosphatase [Candidatus Dormibacteraeota bacterium]
MTEPRVRVRARVRGRVQAVGFRAYVLHHASQLELGGTVANRPDGTVECVAEGPGPAVDTLVRRLHRGPLAARVESVEVTPESPRGERAPMRVTR